MSDLQVQLVAAKSDLAAATAPAASLQAALDQLRALCLADPPPGSGVVKVTRYMTSDGHKHKTWPDAKAHAQRLGLIAKGFTPQASDLIISHGDAAVTAILGEIIEP